MFRGNEWVKLTRTQLHSLGLPINNYFATKYYLLLLLCKDYLNLILNFLIKVFLSKCSRNGCRLLHFLVLGNRLEVNTAFGEASGGFFVFFFAPRGLFILFVSLVLLLSGGICSFWVSHILNRDTEPEHIQRRTKWLNGWHCFWRLACEKGPKLEII